MNLFPSGTYLETHTSRQVVVTQMIYAHRTILPLLVMDIKLDQNCSTAASVQIHLNVSEWYDSEDIDFTEEHSAISNVR